MDTSLSSINNSSSRRQCWECQRRRLVCDSTRPVCTKCKTAGIVCPGFEDKKPLKWVEPGKVNSRRRRKKPDQGTTTTTNKDLVIRPVTAKVVVAARPSKETHSPQIQIDRRDTRVSEVLSRLNWRTDTSDTVEAAFYFNTVIIPDYDDVHNLAKNPYLTHFPVEVIPLLPTSMAHTFVCGALSHRIYTAPEGTSRHLLSESWSRFYYHRGQAIRALTDEVNRSRAHTSNATMASVMFFMYSEIRQTESATWRQHLDGLNHMIETRGGSEKWLRDNSHNIQARGIILMFVTMGVIANTTTPPSNQITAFSRLDLIDAISDVYGEGLFPTLLCPPALFLDIIRVNHLRLQAAKHSHASSSPNASTADELQAEAETLLAQIESFSPEDLALDNNEPYQELWLLLGRTWQSAVALYCLASLQDLSVLPPNASHLARRRREHADRLTLCLELALVRKEMKNFMMWPLVVAGEEAVHASAGARTQVGARLRLMSRELGSPLPLHALEVLERFWRSGRTGWGDCFDRAYAFLV